MFKYHRYPKAIILNGRPRVVNIEKSGTHKMAIWTRHKRVVSIKKIKIRQCKYLKNIVEQDHSNIKIKIGVCTGFKAFESAQRSLSGIEVVSVIKKNQLENSKATVHKTFLSLAA
jgi:putative transposase